MSVAVKTGAPFAVGSTFLCLSRAPRLRLGTRSAVARPVRAERVGDGQPGRESQAPAADGLPEGGAA